MFSLTRARDLRCWTATAPLPCPCADTDTYAFSAPRLIATCRSVLLWMIRDFGRCTCKPEFRVQSFAPVATVARQPVTRTRTASPGVHHPGRFLPSAMPRARIGQGQQLHERHSDLEGRLNSSRSNSCAVAHSCISSPPPPPGLVGSTDPFTARRGTCTCFQVGRRLRVRTGTR
jgi:hypothetical protein